MYVYNMNNMIQKRTQDRQAGFTLIELTLYVSLVSLFMLSFVLFLTTIFEAKERNSIIAEVEGQGRYIVENIRQSLWQSEEVLIPQLWESTNTLSLDLYSGNTRIYTVTDGILSLAENGGTASALHNNQVVTKSVLFRKLGTSNTPWSVQVVFILMANPARGSGVSTTQYEQTFQTTITLPRP